jgi:hypothetical protein
VNIFLCCSYQCNLMVYAAGKYKTVDFVRIGVFFHVSAETCQATCYSVDSSMPLKLV